MSLERQLADYGQHLRQAIADLEVPIEPAVRVSPQEAPTHRRRWLVAAAVGVAVVAAVLLAVLLWARSGDPTPFIDQGSTIPGTTVAVTASTTAVTGTTGEVTTTLAVSTTAGTGAPTTTAATDTTWAVSEVLWDAPLPIPSPSGGPGFGQLVALSADNAWVLAEDRLFHLHDGATFQLRLPPELTGNGPLAVTPDGTLWMTTDLGVFSFDGDAWTQRFVGYTRALTVDGDGAVWIGMLGDWWLARWDGRTFVRVDQNREVGGLSGPTVMAATPDGSIWIAERGYIQSDLYRYAGGSMEAVQIGDYQHVPSNPSAPVGVFDLEVAPNGDLWLAGFDEENRDQVVLARFDGEQWTTYDQPFADQSHAPELYFDLAVGPDGTLWVAFPGGLGSYDGTNWSVRATEFKAYEGGPVDVAPDGTVWYTDGDGLHTLSP